MTEPDYESVLFHYSRALDEIYRLRRAVAYEAIVLDRNTGWKSLPVSVHRTMVRQSARLHQAACGQVEAAYSEVKSETLQEALVDTTGVGTLTRAQWEQQVTEASIRRGLDDVAAGRGQRMDWVTEDADVEEQ